MNEDLKLHIKKLQKKAILSLVSIITVIVSVPLVFLLLSTYWYVAIVLLVISVTCIIYLTDLDKRAKKESKALNYKPVVFNSKQDISFEYLSSVFSSFTEKNNRIITCNHIRFYSFQKVFKTRVILYRTTDFNKKEFDNARERLNRKANKELKISQWVSRIDAGKMMRLNIICADTFNEELYKLISKNAKHNLTRVEGIVNIAVVNNEILLPPLYGNCDIAEISRYKDLVKFITKHLIR